VPAVALARPAGAGGPTPATRVIAGVAYAPAEPAGSRGHLLDLYLPAEPDERPRPLVIWSSGSGFMADNGKDGAAWMAGFFNARGWAVAGVSVRSSSQATFPAQVHDVKAAIRWLRAHAAEHGIDPRRFAIMGNSSGGWLASMVALTGDVRALEGEIGVRGVSSSVQVAVDLYGPTDFLQMDAHMVDRPFFNARFGLQDCHDDPLSPESRLMGCAIRSCPEAVRAADPTTYVTRGAPPMMILHGQADLYVPHHQSELLYAALRERCNTAVFFSIPGVGHEHPYVTDPGRAEGHTVRWTEGCRERVTAGEPEPTWETIERFIRHAVDQRGSS
jgi:acetyl esterase/lipase